MSTVHRLRCLSTIAILGTLVLTSSASAQRRIEGQQVGGSRLFQNPAGQALGNGSVNTPNGVLGNDVLGQGDALDGSLEVGSGGRNYRSRRMNAYTYENLQARNLVVTNNVAGGRGFRGDVGYLAPRDFRGETSDSSTYGFTRDSALSSLDFVNSGRSKDAFNIAQGMGVFQYRREFTSLPEIDSVNAARRIDDAEIRLDRVNPALGSVNLLATAVSPSDIGLVQASEDRSLTASSSTVRGVQYRDPRERNPLGIYDQSLLNGVQITSGNEAAGEYRPRDFEFTPREKQTGRIEGRLSGSQAYDEILDRVYKSYENREDVQIDATTLERLRRDIDRIDASITATRIGDPLAIRPTNTSERREGLPGDRLADPGLADAEDVTSDPLDLSSGDQAGMEDGKETAEKTDEDVDLEDGRKPRTVEELIDALAHRSELGSVVDPRMRARVAEVAGQAEVAMSKGDYFNAESRFDLALRLSPGNPILEAGRANAQIGAGLYRSAAITLGSLYRKHKEMMDVSWAESARPSRTRLSLAVQDLDKMIEEAPGSASGLGLLIAYIGRQVGDRDLITRGLDVIDDARLASLVPQLRLVWLDERPFTGDVDDAGG